MSHRVVDHPNAFPHVVGGASDRAFLACLHRRPCLGILFLYIQVLVTAQTLEGRFLECTVRVLVALFAQHDDYFFNFFLEEAQALPDLGFLCLVDDGVPKVVDPVQLLFAVLFEGLLIDL